MIPVKLSVKNFLSYREGAPTLDLTGVHVACLCGNNGHGKSALLDAITWCLWGKARGRTQDELINYGAPEARVELEFLSRGDLFRVIRSHSRARGRNRPGATDLQLQALNGGDAQPVGGNTVRETQAKIEQLTGMDYETFINSAFLMQGRADEFTSKTPAERKAVLASLLDLQAYDIYQERARRRLEGARVGAAQSAALVEQGQFQIEQIGDPTSELALVAKQLENVEARLSAARKAEEEAKNAVDAGLRRQAELGDLRRNLSGANLEIGQLEAQVSAMERRLRESEVIAEKADEINNGLKRFRETQERFRALEELRDIYEALNGRKEELTQEIALKRVQAEAQLAQLARRIDEELIPKASGEPELAAAAEERRRELASLAKEDQGIARERERQRGLATQIGETKGLVEHYEREGKEIRGKLDLLAQTPEEGAVCPLCSTPLGIDGCGRLANQYEFQVEELRKMFRAARTKLRGLEGEQEEVEKALPIREMTLEKKRRDAQLELQALERQLAESRAAKEEVGRLKPQLARGRAELESERFAAEEMGELHLVEGRIRGVPYRESDWRDSYQEIQELQGFEARARELAQALDRLPEEQEALKQTRELLGRRKDELAELEGRVHTIEASLEGFPELERRLEEAQKEVAGRDGERASYLARKGYLEGQVQRLAEVLRDVEQHSGRLREHEKEQSIFQELVTAFGRQGVQAMLIETVVPRLEEEANLLLGRMTDNQMHVKLETQRERRSGRGEAIETLEINVSDALGPRSYEMYSGGEAFRVNLALRIALSKVLAQRMGAPLPTLFIDEGFGTQDGAGRERILDVISAIQDEFDKIIVITHLDDLKDIFPVRIEVQKDDQGSTFWLS